FGGSDHGVIEGRTAMRIHAVQGLTHKVDLAGKILVKEWLITEVNNKHFVFGITGLDQIHYGFGHSRALGAHGSGVIDHDTDRNRDVLTPERGDVLDLSVFVNLEVGWSKTCHQMAFLVHNRSLKGDLFRLYANLVGISPILRDCRSRRLLARG